MNRKRLKCSWVNTAAFLNGLVGITFFAVLFWPETATAADYSFQDFLQLKAALAPEKNTVIQIAKLLLLPLFTFDIVYQQVKGLDDRPNYWRGIIQLVMVFVALSFYDGFFEKTHLFFKDISVRIFNDQEFANLVVDLEQQFKDGSANSTALFSLKRWSLSNMMMSLSYAFVIISSYFLVILRNALLAFVYVIGPIWLVVSMLPEKTTALYRFFEQVILLNAWSFVANIIFKIMYVGFYQNASGADVGVFELAAGNIVLGSLILFTPLTTNIIAQATGLKASFMLTSMKNTTAQIATIGLLAKGYAGQAYGMVRRQISYATRLAGTQSGETDKGNAGQVRPDES